MAALAPADLGAIRVEEVREVAAEAAGEAHAVAAEAREVAGAVVRTEAADAARVRHQSRVARPSGSGGPRFFLRQKNSRNLDESASLFCRIEMM